MTDTPENDIDPAEYSADSIKVLKGLDAVRKRPGMYIGDTDDGSGLHHMVYEVVDNGIDEALAGHADAVNVKIHADGSVSVSDNGRGIPVGIHEEEGVSAAEVIMTQLHAGGKFDSNSYKVSGGLHGVGVSVVNALSDWLELRIWRAGKEHIARFEGGNTVKHLEVLGDTDRTGTEVRFLASTDTFSNRDFVFETLEKRLRELAFLNSGVRIILEDERPAEALRTELFYEGGVKEFVKYIDRSKSAMMPEPIYVTGEKDDIGVEVAMWWNDSYHETVLPFTNNIPQRDGGTHMAGFRGALTRTINAYAQTSGIARKEKISFTGDDAREGLTFFYRQMPELIENGHLYIAQPPLYKVARGRSEVYIKDQAGLEDYLIEQGVDGAILKLGTGEEITGQDLRRIIDEARTVRRILAAFPTHYPQHILEQSAIAGAFDGSKLEADLQGVADTVARRLDLIALEYEKGWQGRPTQDKGIRLWRVLRGVDEVRTLDGAVLRSGEARRLGQLTPSLQDTYAQPARLIRKDREQPVFGPIDLLQSILEEGEKGLSLQRYKGLGEMNPDQLWETTLDPDARTLLQVKVEDMTEADDIFTKLMGDVVEPRREFIQTNALSVEHLDI